MTKEQQFPVPEAQLPRIHVTPEQHEELRAYMLPMVQEVIREGPTWGRSNVASSLERGWKLVNATPESCFMTKSSGKSYHGLSKASGGGEKRQYQQPPLGAATAASMQAPPTSAQCFMGYSKAPYSLEDIMSSVYCETTEELRVHTAVNFGSVCLDCCVLTTLEGATLEDPFWYVGIKWIALKSPVKSLVSSREFAFLELSGTHVGSDGQRMLYRILQSVNLRGYGGRDAYFGLTRAHLEAAYVYWVDEAASTPEKPVLNVCTKGRAHLKGNLPLWLVQLYLKKMWTLKRARQLEDVLQSTTAAAGELQPIRRCSSGRDRRLSGTAVSAASAAAGRDSAPLDMATTWVPNEERSLCFVCQKRFQLVRRPKHHCRSCGEVICSDCTSYSKLSVRAPPSSLPRKRSSRSMLLSTRSTTSSRAMDYNTYHSSTSDMDAASGPALFAVPPMKARAPKHVVPGEVQGTYVTVGKVCLRCMDLKTIMHNNSTAFHRHQLSHSSPSSASNTSTGVGSNAAARGTHVVLWHHGLDVQQFENLLTLHPERDASATEDMAEHTSSSFARRFGVGALGDEEEKHAAHEPDRKSSGCGSGGGWRNTGMLINASKYRKGSVSSLTSSDVRAIIEENAESHETESLMTDGEASSRGTGTGTGTGRSVMSVDEHDDEEEEENEGNEDLEFKPVLTSAVSAHQLLASSEAAAVVSGDHDSGYSSGSLSNFNPDFLFDLHDDDEQLSDDDGADGDSGGYVSSDDNMATAATKRVSNQELPQLIAQEKQRDGALLSPTTSSTQSTPSWPRSRSHTGTVSIADVKLAIADHARLLDGLRRERRDQENQDS